MKDKLMAILKNNEAEFNRMVRSAAELAGDCINDSVLACTINDSQNDECRAESMSKLINSSDSKLVRAGFCQWVDTEFKRISKPSTVDRACKLIQGRANVGQVKYGVSIDRDDLTASDWAQHALEEMLDGAQYLIRLKDEMEALQKENAELKRELSAKNPELSPELSAKNPELSPELSAKSPELKHKQKQELTK